jgi:hypothetical protein
MGPYSLVGVRVQHNRGRKGDKGREGRRGEEGGGKGGVNISEHMKNEQKYRQRKSCNATITKKKKK